MEPLFPGTYTALQPAADSVRSFDQMIADYEARYLVIPAHQRDAEAWPDQKRQKYIERLKQSADGCHPPGSFATYQLTGSDRPGPIWLNDGYQRLSTLRELKNAPGRYDLDPDSAHALLRQTISVQHRHYGSHDAAMRDFQLINNGTRLTPHELCRGFLKYMDGYENIWEPQLKAVEEAIKRSEAILRAKNAKGPRKGDNRETEHKRLRHSLALFHRFLSSEKGAIGYDDVSATEVQKYVEKNTAIELRLRNLLLQRGHQDCAKQVDLFQTFVENETAFLEECIEEVLGRGYGLAAVTHRWLLDLAVWRRNNSHPRASYELFVKKLLGKTKGQAQWVGHENKVVTLRLSALGMLPTLADWAEMPEFCEPKRRKRAPSNLRAGYDNSHFEPFVLYGEGPASPESAPANRSRQAKPRIQ